MPTQIFFHLPKEKQKRLIEVVKIEFFRIPLREASVANIVELVGIPRGSSYQYSEGKEDLYFYRLETVGRSSSKDMLQLMKESDGDLFKGLESYFSKMIYEILESKNAPLYRNSFMNMNYRISRRVAPYTSHQKMPHDPYKEHKQDAKELLELIDRTKLKVKNNHGLELLTQLVMNTIFTTIAYSYRLFSTSENYSVEQAISEFNLKLPWLKSGVYK